MSIIVVYNKFKAKNVGIARFLKYLKHKVYTPRPIVQFFTAVKHGNFQMKMYDIVLFCFALKHRSRVYLNKLGCVRPAGVPKKVFLAVVAGNVTT